MTLFMSHSVKLIGLCLIVFLSLTGCKTLQVTGNTAKAIGKVAWGTAKITGKTLKATGKVALKTGQLTSKSVRTIVYIAKGKQIIPLTRKGNSYYAKVKINRKANALFLVDTGASSVHISRSMAKRLKLKLDKGEPTFAKIAGGQIVSGRIIKLKEIKIGRVRIKNIKAIVFDQDNMAMQDGLLGMSFLNHFVFQIDTKKPELILQRRVE